MARSSNAILWTSVLIVFGSICVSFAEPVANYRDTNQDTSQDILRYLAQLESRLATVESKLVDTELELVQQREVTARQEKEIKRQNDLIKVLLKRTDINTERLDNDKIITENNEKTKNIHRPEGFDNEDQSVKNISYDLSSDNPTVTGRRIARQVEVVAFSAYLAHDVTGLGPAHTIVLDGVYLNDGNAYNKFTGIFTVPIDGVYLLFFACQDYHSHRIYTQLVVDGVAKSTILEFANGQHAMGANTVILKLTVGQSVWVRTHPKEGGDSFQIDTTTFSGTLLYST
ncbi:positive regulation of adiponectin secretion [Mactra antiquata]